jgi:hypothetical protein
MNNPFQQLKNALKKVHMTPTEKSALRMELFALTQNNPFIKKESLQSPYALFFTRTIQFSTFALIIILGGGGSLAFASQNTLPGEALYNFKVQVVEEIVSATKSSGQEKAQYAIERATKRLDETATLALSNQLDTKTELLLSQRLAEHASEAKNIASSVEKTEPEVELEIDAKIASAISPRTIILKKIQNREQEKNDVRNILAVADSIIVRSIQDKEDTQREFNTSIKLASADTVSEKAQQVNERLQDLTLLSETSVNEPPLESEVTSHAIVEQKILVENLITEAQVKIEAAQYGEALVLLQEAEQAAETTLILADLTEEFSFTEIKLPTTLTEVVEPPKNTPEAPATLPTINPASIELTVLPGAEYRGSFRIKNTTSEVQKYTRSRDQQVFLDYLKNQKTDLESYQKTISWISTEYEFILEPGQEKEIPYLVRIPENTPPQDDAFIIFWKTQNPAMKEIGFSIILHTTERTLSEKNSVLN